MYVTGVEQPVATGCENAGVRRKCSVFTVHSNFETRLGFARKTIWHMYHNLDRELSTEYIDLEIRIEFDEKSRKSRDSSRKNTVRSERNYHWRPWSHHHSRISHGLATAIVYSRRRSKIVSERDRITRATRVGKQTFSLCDTSVNVSRVMIKRSR